MYAMYYAIFSVLCKIFFNCLIKQDRGILPKTIFIILRSSPNDPSNLSFIYTWIAQYFIGFQGFFGLAFGFFWQALMASMCSEQEPNN